MNILLLDPSVMLFRVEVLWDVNLLAPEFHI